MASDHEELWCPNVALWECSQVDMQRLCSISKEAWFKCDRPGSGIGLPGLNSHSVS